MKIHYHQLNSQLKKQLHSIYLLHSDEILLLQESIDTIRETAKSKGYLERIVIDGNSEWEKQLHAEVYGLSLFSSKKIIELRLAAHKPNASAVKILIDLAAKPLNDVILIISANKLDSKTEQTKWYKAIDKAGLIIQIWPVSLEQLPNWIMDRAKQKGCSINPTLAQFIANQVEGNLFAAAQEIEKLALLNTNNLDDQKDLITDNACYDIFNLVECALLGNANRCLRILHYLQAEGTEPILVLWALTKELRLITEMAYQLKQGQTLTQLFAQFRIWEKRQKPIKYFLSQHPLLDCRTFIQQAAAIDKIIKGIQPGNVWQELQLLVLKMGKLAIRSNTTTSL